MTKLTERREYFNRHLPKLEGADRRNDIKGLGNTCPSCGYPTLDERNAWEICSICFWEDDGQDDKDADKVFGGPNSDYSLTQYRNEWDSNLDEIKISNSETGKYLRRIDELIVRDNKSDIPEILKLVKSISDWFDNEREIEK
ncbi:CPCC family cysteine-rich protein [Alistipes sp. ZOR0009]|uniref:CPCC family cysteine-rich protein n=1 Tax=Alistipes sp. ZOR0009 TaxID=1339253 RepID=UPI0006480B23|nr:CPCC family cysteine-rich protein [Alistipes sp. ZOR0009]